MMTSKESLLGQLEKLYIQLEKPFSMSAENPCGRCRECCTGRGLSSHHVTPIELELIASRVGEERLGTFRRFLARNGEIEVCPYFDDQTWGCGIYQQRPYSCRVFGNYRRVDTRLPEVCVFSGQESIFGVGEYLKSVPLAAELKELARAFWPYQREHFQGGEAGEGGLAIAGEEGDALDRALSLMNEGRLEEALLTFERSELPSTPYVLYCLTLVFEGMERYGDARTALAAALGLAPECVPLWFRLGCNLTLLGESEEAEEAFRKVIEIAPQHALAHAFLGSHALNEGRYQKAAVHLTRSLKLAPNPTVENWLEQALHGLEVF